MDHRIPKVGVAVSLAFVVAAMVTFVYLNLAFEGPSVVRLIGGEGYELTTTVKDTEAIPTKQPVLINGLEVGKVKGIEYNREDATATIEFTIDDEYAPIHRDATVAIGERSLLGDAYLRLEPGNPEAGELESGDEVRWIPSVDFDEALDFLDAGGRRHVRSIIGELREATRDPRGPERLNLTVGGLARTTRELRDLTDALRGQEDDLAGLVRDSAIVLDELGSREAALRAIVSAGRATLDALAANAASLDRGLAELAPLLTAGRGTLAASRPLVRDLRPLVAELRRAAPQLAPVLGDLPSVSADAAKTVSGLSGIPTLRELLTIIKRVGPTVPRIESVTRNLVSLLDYSAPRAAGLGAFFTNLAGANAHGDSTGRWLRVAAVLEPGLILGFQTPASCRPEDDVGFNFGACANAYPPPGDAADNEPYVPGSYPRLRPFRP